MLDYVLSGLTRTVPSPNTLPLRSALGALGGEFELEGREECLQTKSVAIQPTYPHYKDPLVNESCQETS